MTGKLSKNKATLKISQAEAGRSESAGFPRSHVLMMNDAIMWRDVKPLRLCAGALAHSRFPRRYDDVQSTICAAQFRGRVQ